MTSMGSNLYNTPRVSVTASKICRTCQSKLLITFTEFNSHTVKVEFLLPAYLAAVYFKSSQNP